MNAPDSIFEQMNNFNENLIANIQGGVITCQFDPKASTSKQFTSAMSGQNSPVIL